MFTPTAAEKAISHEGSMTCRAHQETEKPSPLKQFDLFCIQCVFLLFALIFRHLPLIPPGQIAQSGKRLTLP